MLLHGNVHDLFELQNEYQSLLPMMLGRLRAAGVVRVVYELNGPIRFIDDADRERVRDTYVAWRLGLGSGGRDALILRGLVDDRLRAEREHIETQFETNLRDAVGRPTAALELLRQLCLCSRQSGGRERLLIVIEAADLLLPAGEGDITRLPQADRTRVQIVQDWFSDPGFLDAGDSVVLIVDSVSGVHPRVTGLPQVAAVEVLSPDAAARRAYVEHDRRGRGDTPRLAMGMDEFVTATGGLSLQALRQLLVRGRHRDEPVDAAAVTARVERHVVTQLGEEMVEFKRPTHSLDDVIGASRLVKFLRQEFIPRLRAEGDAALSGAAVAGPIGAGKTYIFEAVAGELGLPVLVLKNIRSQYFGQTDVLFERLRRVLSGLGKVIIFVDEADTMFGGLGAEAHPTERRLTGKVQAMMSDPALRGRVVWLLMTARIERLSADLRRPGRVGDLIIPVLDPPHEGEDRRKLVRWATGLERAEVVEAVTQRTASWSAAGYAALRSRLRAEAALHGKPLEANRVMEVVHDQLPAEIEPQRRYQALQAMLNCTRRSLLPPLEGPVEEARAAWREEVRGLEVKGFGL